MTAIKRSAQASLVFIHSGALPPAGISQSWTATSCPASMRVHAIQCALVRSAELKLMKNFCPIEERVGYRNFPCHQRVKVCSLDGQTIIQVLEQSSTLEFGHVGSSS